MANASSRYSFLLRSIPKLSVIALVSSAIIASSNEVFWCSGTSGLMPSSFKKLKEKRSCNSATSASPITNALVSVLAISVGIELKIAVLSLFSSSYDCMSSILSEG